MKLVALVLAVVAILAVGPVQSTDSLPYDTVRMVRLQDHQHCSAVVIAPGIALTAAHCLQRHITVDGLKVDGIVAPADDKDIAVLRVPGLKCPCAVRGVRPAKGDQVLAVGFPANRDGEQAISPVARVRSVGELRLEFPFLADMEESAEHFIVTDAPIVSHGDSGGALFSMQNGSWKVVGITAIGIPDPEVPCMPFVGCTKEIASGFVPVDLAEKFL
jgi:S1-C subfamily serine protease